MDFSMALDAVFCCAVKVADAAGDTALAEAWEDMCRKWGPRLLCCWSRSSGRGLVLVDSSSVNNVRVES